MFSFIIAEVSPSISPCLNVSLTSCVQLEIDDEEMVTGPVSWLRGVQMGESQGQRFSCDLRL